MRLVNNLKNNISKRDLIYFFFMIVLFLSSIFFSAVSLFSSNFSLNITWKVIFIIFLLCINVYSLCKTKTNLPFSLLVFEFIYLVFGVTALLLNNDYSLKLLFGFGNLFTSILLINTVFLARRIFGRRTFILFGSFVVFFSIMSCIYSNVAEFEIIKNAFISSGEDAHYFQVHSFLDSRNAYGFLLFVSVVFLLFFIYSFRRSRIFSFFALAYIFTNLLISRCKIAIFCSSLLLALFVIYFFKWLFKHSRKSFIIVLVITLLIFATLLCVIFVPTIYLQSTFLIHLNHYFTETLFGQAYRSFLSRLLQFDSVSPLFHDARIIVGFGESNTSVLINGVMYNIYIDNAYASLLLSGGIPKVLLFLSVLFLFVLNVVYRLRISTRPMFFSLCLLVSFLAYGMFEGYSLIGTSFYSMMWLIILFGIPNNIVTNNNVAYKESINILHVVGSFNKGGTESFILNYYEEIVKHKQIVFDIYCFGEADSEQVNRLNKIGGKIFFGTAPSKTKLLKSIISFTKFLFINRKYRIIHCSANFDNFVFLHVSNLFDFDLRIEHAHDTLTGIHFSKIQLILNSLKRVMNNFNSNKMFACSIEAANDIFGSNYRNGNYSVIPNSINFRKFININTNILANLISKYNLSNKKVFGNISRFEDKKNQQFIIDLFSEYHKKDSNSVLVLGGTDGGTMHSLQEKVNDLDCKSSIVFIGPRSDVEYWLHIFDIYMMPSLFEGFGISAIEAQVAGAYVLASNNLPKTVDIGIKRIDFISLQNKIKWLELMEKQNRNNDINIENAKYNIENDYKFLLSEYMVVYGERKL